MLAKLAGALNQGGRLVLAFRPAGADISARFRDDPTYRFPRLETVEAALTRAGLSVAGVRVARAERGVMLVEAIR